MSLDNSSFNIPFDFSTTLNLAFGSQIYELKLNLKANSSLQTTITEIFATKKIPLVFKDLLKQEILNEISSELKRRSNANIISFFRTLSSSDPQQSKKKKNSNTKSKQISGISSEEKSKDNHDTKFSKIFSYVFSAKNKTQLVRVEEDMNRLFLRELQKLQQTYFSFSKIPNSELKKIRAFKAKQKGEYEGIIREIYKQSLKMKDEYFFEKIKHKYAEESGSNVNAGKNSVFGMLKNRKYQLFEIFANEKILTNYSYLTRKTIKIIVIYSTDLTKMLCAYGKNETQQRLENISRLYQDKLNALICTCYPVVEENKKSSRKRVVNFEHNENEMKKIWYTASFSLSPELHFEQIEDQKEKVLFDLNVMVKERVVSINPGHFFITKHSNLAHVNLIFNLVTEKYVKGNKEKVNYKNKNQSKVLQGLSEIFHKACFSFSNTFVYLPFFQALKDEKEHVYGTKKHQYLFNEFEEMIKCFKNGLQKYQRYQKIETVSLDHFCIFVPNHLHDNELFQTHVANVVSGNFKIREKNQKVILKNYFT